MTHSNGWNTPLLLRTIAIATLVLSWPNVSFGQVTSYAFVPNVIDGTVTVINTADNAVGGGPITVDTMPRTVAFTPDGRRAYLVDRDSGASATMLKAIDVVSRTVVANIPIGVDSPTAMVITPNGQTLYIVQGANVVPVNVSTHVVGTPFTGPGPVLRSIDITPDGLTAYVTTNVGTYPLNVSDGVFGTAIPTSNSDGLAISPDGQTAYVVNLADDQVVVVDLGTQSVSGPPINVGTDPWDVEFSPDGTLAYVANTGSNDVSVIDTATRAVVDTVPAGSGPTTLAFTPDGRYVYVLNTNSANVTVIDVQARTEVAGSPLPVGNAPYADGGGFITPNIIVQPGGPFSIANDAALTAAGFKQWVPFHQGTLRLTGDWTTTRGLSLLDGGGTIDTNGFNAAISGDVRNDGQLTKNGAGTLRLSGVKSHGGTTVNAGTFMLQGTHMAPLTVTAGALRGHGTLGNVTVGDATWAPGDGSIGLMEANDVTMSAATTLELHLAETAPGVGYDAIVNSGPAAINGARLVVVPAFVPARGDRFQILNNATGTFHDLPEGATFNAGGYGFKITYAGGDGNDVVLIYDDAPVVLVGPQTIPEDAGPVNVLFTLDDDHPNAPVTMSAVSMNQTLLADADITILDPRSTMRLTTRPNAHGVVEIRVTASDGLTSRTASFILTVNPVNDAPTITPPPPQTIPENTALAPVAFTVNDIDSDIATLTVTATATSLPSPQSIIVLGGSGATRTIALNPILAVRGPIAITLTATDGQATSSTFFVVTVVERNYYLAEGATGPFFDTDILIANPNATAAPIVITFLKDDGMTIVENRTLTPASRTTIHADDIMGLENTTFSTVITSTDVLPIVVERTMRWGEGGYGAHTEKATAGASYEWAFAEGAQTDFFSTYFLLGNPNATANRAWVSYLREGEPPLYRDYALAPHSRTTIEASLEPELQNRSFGALILFEQPAVAERAMYFGDNPTWLGGHGAAGTVPPYSLTWYLAEGATGDYFTTYLLFANTLFEPANVTVTYLPDTGVPVTKTFTIKPDERVTRNIALEDPSLAHAAVATSITSTQPIVVERAQYWGRPAWIDAHVSGAVPAAAPRWGLAEGRVGGADEAQTYILLANPGTDPADVTITFLRESGENVTKTFTVQPTSRFNVSVVPGGGMVPELTNESFGARIESTLPIVVERSLYTNANGFHWAAGTNATATRLP